MKRWLPMLALALIVQFPALSLDLASIDTAAVRIGKPASIQAAAQTLGAITNDPYGRARAAYAWVAHNIAYDTESFFSGAQPITSADGVFRSGRSVCQGYSELFASLCRALGLEAQVISGYAKAYSYRPGDRFTQTDHAWNAVKIGGRWRLMDTTWGAGYVKGRSFVKEYTAAWFDMDPRIFVLNHFPEDRQWLLYQTSMTLADYERAPLIETYDLERLTDAGLAPATILGLLPYAPFEEHIGYYTLNFLRMGGNGEDLPAYLAQKAMPQAYQYDGYEPKLVEYPRTVPLKAGYSYRFAIRVPNCEQAAIISGGEFHFLERDGDLFSGTVKVAGGEVKLSARITSKGKTSYWPFVIWTAR